MGEMKVENWQGYEIRFIEQDGEWWAVLKDICDALGLKTFHVAQRLNPDMMIKVKVKVETNIPSRYTQKDDIVLTDINFSNTFTKKVTMTAVNEFGVYEALFASKRLEARKLRQWIARMMKEFRKNVGLKGYEVMRMTENDIQEEINHLLDDIFYDEERGMLMQMVTLPGGDADVIPCKYWPR